MLDLALLSLIAEEPSYGYEMVEKMRKRGLEPVAEGSIYPLLTRMQKGGYVKGYMVDSDGGSKRKYYRILPAGEERLANGIEEWRLFSESADRILRGS